MVATEKGDGFIRHEYFMIKTSRPLACFMLFTVSEYFRSSHITLDKYTRTVRRTFTTFYQAVDLLQERVITQYVLLLSMFCVTMWNEFSYCRSLLRFFR